MKEIEAYCKIEKSKDSTFRYQIRLGHNDLILKIKKGLQQFQEVNLDFFGPLTPLSIPIYKGNNIWEEKNTPPKGRNKKRQRSLSKSPTSVNKKINLRPEYIIGATIGEKEQCKQQEEQSLGNGSTSVECNVTDCK